MCIEQTVVPDGMVRTPEAEWGAGIPLAKIQFRATEDFSEAASRERGSGLLQNVARAGMMRVQKRKRCHVNATSSKCHVEMGRGVTRRYEREMTSSSSFWLGGRELTQKLLTKTGVYCKKLKSGSLRPVPNGSRNVIRWTLRANSKYPGLVFGSCAHLATGAMAVL
ncbi:hypothetical protein B0H14DRAFT_2621166 [Mycena olivaceomarginata]|nr:hypothetical protein B0H14DRAFT_2621166 [Mycena olivaceomarginata]